MKAHSVLAVALSTALLASLCVGCQGNTRRPVFNFDERVQSVNTGAGGVDITETQPPLRGDAASYKVPKRDVINFVDVRTANFGSVGISPFTGQPYESQGFIQNAQEFRSPYFRQKSNDETMPDAGNLQFEVDSSHVRVPTDGGMVWVRARIAAPSFVNARNKGMNVALLLDVSESMKDPGKIDLLKRAARSIISQMLPSDQLSLIAFNDSAHVLVPSESASDQSVLIDAIDQLKAGGRANLGAGLFEAFAELETGRERSGTPGQVVLISDGLLGGQSGWRSVDLARARRTVGHRVNAFAVGESAEPSLMKTLTEAGEGRFAMIATPRQVEGAVAREMQGLTKTFAKNVRLRVLDEDVRVLAAHGTGLRNAPAGAKEFVLGDFASGDRRSVLLRLKLPPLPPQGHTTIRIQLFSERIAPRVDRTMREWPLSFRGAASFGDSNPSVEAHATLVHGLDYLRRALDGEGDVFIERVDEIHKKQLPRIMGLAAADADPEILKLAESFDQLAGRLAKLENGEGGDDSFTRLKRDFYYRR